ncbi:MAG: alcohol dehydrogenase catalytic domain-containing protein, partial [Myxococcales bacterium]|nr:alcohol dehydrogenase catalytic domain-containing protein [Myxococcales bacterium]
MVVQRFADDPADAIDNALAIEVQPFPDVTALAPTDVVIAVESAAVGWVDLLMTSGQYQHMAKPPYTPGLEYSGVVAWVGAEVREHAVGDAVLADGLRTGPRSLGAHQRWGGFARYAVAPAEALLPVPGNLD